MSDVGTSSGAHEVIEVILTGAAEWVQPFVEAAITDRLIACAHQMAIDATYRWEGQIHRDPEIRACLHTSPGAVDALLRRIDEQHPYDVPCVMASTMRASSAYATWVAENTVSY